MHLALWTPPHTQRVIGGGHVLISGAPGAGKSHLLREAIVPGLVASGAQVLVIDYADVIGAKI
jgi:DNA replication protein DnaC